VTFTPDPGNDFDTTGGSTHHPLDFVDPTIPDQTSGAASVTRTFAQPGSYAFFCRNHGTANGSGMAGTVIVEAPGTATTTGQTTTSTSQTTMSTQPPSASPAPAPAGADTSAPRVAITRLTVAGLRRHAAAIRFTSSEPGRASATLTARGTVLARGVKTFTSGTQALSLKITSSGRRLLRRAPRLKARLSLAVRDAAGNTSRLGRSVTVSA
jgi:hypothetical protein